MDSRYYPSSSSYHRKKALHNTGPVYTMTGSGGAQVLMNTSTIVTATSLQFLTPIRSKSTMCNDTLASSIVDQLCFNDIKSASLSSSVPMKSSINVTSAPKMSTVNVSNDRLDGINALKMISGSNTINNTTKTDGHPLLNAIKGFFSSLIRPIMNQTSAFDQFSQVKSDLCNIGHGSEAHNYKTQITDCENLTFFDCDDYVDSEDTVDFIAKSLPSRNQYTECNDIVSISSTDNSPKSYAFFDCISNFADPISKQSNEMKAILPTINNEPFDGDVVEPIVPTVPTEGLVFESSKNIQIVDKKLSKRRRKRCKKQKEINKKQQQNQEKQLIQIDDNECGFYRSENHQRKGQRINNNKAHYRSAKSLACGKNRHEKIRHQIEMEIHDEMNVAFDESLLNVSDNEDDLVLVECDDIEPKTETEEIEAINNDGNDDYVMPIDTNCSGSMFTCFIPFNTTNCLRKPPSLTPRKLQRWSSSARTLNCQDDSDDSDDENIDSTVFATPFSLRKTCERQRQISECSDDFICFEYEDEDEESKVLRNGVGTDEEEFTESDDSDSDSDSDSSDEEEDDDENDDECGAKNNDESVDDSDDEVESVHGGCSSTEHNQPDSGFEEKKVRFNLRPQIREIRAWKFAYREARKGKWEQIGRDRERFEKKIAELGRHILPVLEPKHRERIFNERFQAMTNEQTKPSLFASSNQY